MFLLRGFEFTHEAVRELEKGLAGTQPEEVRQILEEGNRALVSSKGATINFLSERYAGY